MFSKRPVLAALAAAPLVVAVLLAAGGAVPQGSPEKSRAYYESTATTLRFRDAKSILDSTLDDVPRYLGYSGLSGRDLERIAPSVLMDFARLGTPPLTAIPSLFVGRLRSSVVRFWTQRR